MQGRIFYAMQGTLTLLSYTEHMEYEMTGLAGYTYSNFCAVREFVTCPINAFTNFMHEIFWDNMQIIIKAITENLLLG